MSYELVSKEISNYFSDKKVSKVYLFGSFAKNTENAESDIDILIDLTESIGLMRLIQYKLDLEDKLHKKIDLQTFGSISQKIFPLIKNDLKLIYERK